MYAFCKYTPLVFKFLAIILLYFCYFSYGLAVE